MPDYLQSFHSNGENGSGLYPPSGTAENGVLELTVLNPVLWNAENPYLYQVILTMPDEVIVDRIGFRTIEIKDKVVYFNGEKIKFRGVNRHDSDPETGFVIYARHCQNNLIQIRILRIP